jgi:hypothetical protein
MKTENCTHLLGWLKKCLMILPDKDVDGCSLITGRNQNYTATQLFLYFFFAVLGLYSRPI